MQIMRKISIKYTSVKAVLHRKTQLIQAKVVFCAFLPGRRTLNDFIVVVTENKLTVNV